MSQDSVLGVIGRRVWHSKPRLSTAFCVSCLSRQAKVEDKRPSIERFCGKLDDVVSNPKVKHLNSGASFVNCQCGTLNCEGSTKEIPRTAQST